MEPYILFVHLSVLTPKQPAKELTWTAEFTSEQSCEAAAKALEPIQEVVESDESVVILWLALDSREGESARCGSLNIALLRTAAVFVIRVI